MFRPLAVFLVWFRYAPPFAASQLASRSVEPVIVSVRDQKLMLLDNGGKVATYPVSTSKFGLGDFWGRMTTPLGYLAGRAKNR